MPKDVLMCQDKLLLKEVKNFSDWITIPARAYPKKIAFVYNDQKYNYEYLIDHINRFANALIGLGIVKNDKVSLFLPNCSEFIIAFLAVVRIGAVIVPINIHYKAKELKYILEHSESKVCVVDERLISEVLPIKKEIPSFASIILIDRKGDSNGNWGENEFHYANLLKEQSGKSPEIHVDLHDDAVFRYTSGTTGNPKACVCSHRSCIMTNQWLADLWQLDEDDRSFVVLPLFHNFGQGMTFPFLSRGGSVVIREEFKAEEVLGQIAHTRPTIFSGVPTMYILMLESQNIGNYDLRFLRILVYGGAKMPVETILRLRESFSCELMNIYGLSESGSIATYNSGDCSLSKSDSVGKPFPQMEIRIIDPSGNTLPKGEIGEICLRSEVNMKEYYKSPHSTNASMKGGWLHTGDMGYLDCEDFLFLTDRKDDLIVRGGENIYPRELEEILYTHPKVLVCAVIGVPDHVMGKVVKAFIVPRSGENISSSEVIAYLKKRVADYKVPKYVEFLESMPMTPSGKISKKDLHNRFL